MSSHLRIINNYEINKIYITGHEKREDRWHMYEVMLTKDEMTELSKHIFKDKQFEFNYDERETWTDVLKYGRALGIPEARLDFPINGL